MTNKPFTKAKIFLVVMLAVLLFSSAACSDLPYQVLNVDQSYSGKEVKIAAYGTLTVSLESNPADGYSWVEKAKISNVDYLEQTKHEFIPSKTPEADAPGTQVWTFTALGSGTSTITIERQFPLVANVSPEPFTLNVIVK